MKLFRFKATDNSEPTMVFIAAESAADAVHALMDHDLGDTDWESLKPYLHGEKRPIQMVSIEKVPEDYHDSIYYGSNEDEQTVQEFFTS